MKFEAVYYDLPSGRVPVQEFVDSLELATQESFFVKIGLLEEFGSNLRYPHTKNIGEGIFELRLVSRQGQVRVLFFFFDGARVVLTNGFIKKQQKTPQKEIRLAEKRRREFIDRRRNK